MAEEPQTEQLSEKIKTLIRGANFGDLATLMRDGAAKTNWYCNSRPRAERANKVIR
jgi:hypothetical protein